MIGASVELSIAQLLLLELDSDRLRRALNLFFDQLADMPDARLGLARRVPAALPLLTDNLLATQAVLEFLRAERAAGFKKKTSRLKSSWPKTRKSNT